MTYPMSFVGGTTAYFKKHGTLPTVTELKNVYNLPAEGDPTYEKREQMFLWYHDDFLPMALGQEECARKICHYSSPVSLRDAGNGKKLPTATCIGEAFGLVVYENCRAKWLAIFSHGILDDKWPIPKYSKMDHSTHQYHQTKWTDSKNGQVKDAGWGHGTFTAMNECINFIAKRRMDDEANDFKKHRFAFDLMRRHNNITFASPNDKARNKKKQHREPPTYAVLMLDEPDMEMYEV
jgi:hypothetical protein